MVWYGMVWYGTEVVVLCVKRAVPFPLLSLLLCYSLTSHGGKRKKKKKAVVVECHGGDGG
jgi:hypothetical protein